MQREQPPVGPPLTHRSLPPNALKAVICARQLPAKDGHCHHCCASLRGAPRAQAASERSAILVSATSRGAEGAAFVLHDMDAGTSRMTSRPLRRCARAVRAGIVAASMARRCQNPFKRLRMFFSTRYKSRRGRVGWGADRRRDRRDARQAGEPCPGPTCRSPGQRPARSDKNLRAAALGKIQDLTPCRLGPTCRSPGQQPARSDKDWRAAARSQIQDPVQASVILRLCQG
jgi:hypothetical protein